MSRLGLLRFVSLTFLAAAAVATAHEGDAAACGGCFVAPVYTDRTVVTDHRMAFAISTQQTVLWDQIKYSGDPKEFAWVLPVHPGAVIELSNDAFFAALDASTQPVVTSPAYYGGGYGCALAGCGASSADNAAGPSGDQVQVLSQAVIGPYETVTLRSTDAHALETWLGLHGFTVPFAIQPTIDAYTQEGFDFIALRLVPSCGERSMKPVRIVSPGADASLPLRMVAAGVGTHVGITLYVIGEGRYRPQNFPEVLLDDAKLTWDRAQNRSNYEELSAAAMATSKGHAWLTEFAGPPNLVDNGYGYGTYYGTANPGLAQAYFSVCRPRYGFGGGGGDGGVTQPPPCTSTTAHDAGTDAEADAGANADAEADAGANADAEADAGATTDAETDAAADAGADASTTDAGSPYAPPVDTCAGFDDLTVAFTGMHTQDIWVTRLRAVLPSDALTVGDLRLEAASQVQVSNIHQALHFSDETGSQARGGCKTGPRDKNDVGTWVVIGVSAIGLLGAARRRMRRPR